MTVKQPILIAVLFLMACGLVCSCATSKTASSQDGWGLAGSVSTERAARQEVELARKMVDSGDTSSVIPRLLNLISKYPSTPAALDARYLLGIAYYKIGGYRDAIEMLNEYLRLAPQGPHAAQAAEQVARLTDEYSNKYPTPTELDAKVRSLSDKVIAAPQDVNLQMELAQMLWMRGDYSKAGKIYAGIVSVDPRYAEQAMIKSRMEFLPNGEYMVLSPVEVERRQVESQPLAVINTASFRSGQDLFTREARFYSVTGQVVNRSDSVLYGVEVAVTIYGFGNVVYDTTTVAIGRLNPSEIRAFSVRFSNFDNIENINRYEAVATFQR